MSNHASSRKPIAPPTIRRGRAEYGLRGLAVAVALASCDGKAGQVDPPAPDVDTGPCAPTPTADTTNCDENQVLDWPTYTLLGTPDVDDGLGGEASVGDIDGDGMDDVAMVASDVGALEPNVYLVLGATLLGYPPGGYYVGDIADYTFVLQQYVTCGGSGVCGDGFKGSGLHLHDGELYVGNPASFSKPLAYQITWPSLLAAGPGIHAVGDVAERRFEAADGSILSYGVGKSIQVCDVNGDGERDLLLSDECSDRSYDHGYLLLGPFSSPSVDLAANAAVLEDPSTSRWGSCTLGACTDYNGDGFDDFSVITSDPSAPEEPILGIYYGSAAMGASGIIDLADRDVTISFTYDTSVTSSQIHASAESVADWDGDGNMDLLTQTRSVRDDGVYESGASLFLGECGFFPTGTTLDQSDRYLSVGADGTYVGRGASLAGDLNGDGIREVVLGHAWDDALGSVDVRYCPLGPGDYGVREFSETTYPSDEEVGYLGALVIASGDIDGNGIDDLVVGAPSHGIGAGAVYVTIN